MSQDLSAVERALDVMQSMCKVKSVSDFVQARAALMDAIRAEVEGREGINPNKVLCDDCPARWPASLPAADARAGWETMESAPKDGSVVLLLCPLTLKTWMPSHLPLPGYWDARNGWLSINHDAAVSLANPTHFMALPPPPLQHSGLRLTTRGSADALDETTGPPRPDR